MPWLVVVILGGLGVSALAKRAGERARNTQGPGTRDQPIPGVGAGNVRMKLVGDPRVLGLHVPCFLVPNSAVQKKLAEAGIRAVVWSDVGDLPRDWPRDERGRVDPQGCTFFAEAPAAPPGMPAELRAVWRAP